ncbi:MAG: hypothetical protein WD689_08180 [Gaiellaceae bacterium]
MKKALLSLLLLACALPAAAVAEENPRGGGQPDAEKVTLEFEGPLKLNGKGRLRGELKMAALAETRAVVIGGQVGAIKFVDLAGDLRVKCQGRGKAVVREDDEGHKVVVCRGRGGRAKVHGSHFELQLVARQYGALIPAGVTGMLQGHFRSCIPGETCAAGENERGRDGQRPPRDGSDKPSSDEDAEESIDKALDDAIDAVPGEDG